MPRFLMDFIYMALHLSAVILDPLEPEVKDLQMNHPVKGGMHWYHVVVGNSKIDSNAIFVNQSLTSSYGSQLTVL